MIPESIVSFKPGPPPRKSPRQAAVQAAAAISEEAEEEKNDFPLKGHRFGHQATLPPSRAGFPKPPFVWGQIGTVIYTSKPAQFLSEMPDGCLLFVPSWHKAIPELEPHGKYVLTDPFGGVWYVPDAFNEWWQGVETGSFPDIDLEVTQLVIVCEGIHFSLCTSKSKQSYHDVLHPVGSNTDKL